MLGVNITADASSRPEHQGPPPLYFDPADSWRLLPCGFPDMKVEVKQVASTLRISTVAELLAALDYQSGVEYLCMDLCLARGCHRWLVRHAKSAEFLRQVGPLLMPTAKEMKEKLGVMPSLETVLDKLLAASAG